MNTIDVAFCADRNIRVGLHVAVYSMLTNLADGATINLHILTDSLIDSDFTGLEDTISRTGVPVNIQRYTIDLDRFRSYKWLIGWMSYARILVPNIIQAERVLYLDSDLIVGTDVSSLSTFDMEGKAIAAVSRQKIRETNDKEFFHSLHVDLDQPYFNAGVLLIDLNKWNGNDLVTKCLETADRFGRRLPSADQTVLNYVFNGDGFASLPAKYNLPIGPDRERVSPEKVNDRVVHLIGFPKPWSFLGEFLNQQAHLYTGVLEKTYYSDYKSYKHVSIDTIRLTIRKIRSYAKSSVHFVKNLLLN